MFQLNRATPQLRSLAKHLIVSETLSNKSSKAENPATFLHVTEKLRPHLATLMGNAGFSDAPFARTCGGQHGSFLAARRARARGRGFGRVGATSRATHPTEFLEGRVVLLAQLLGLLVAFIGPSLTSRLVDEIWGCGLDHKTVSGTQYRKRAQKMRKLAADHTAEDVRDEILSLADDYDRIALSADGTNQISRKNMDFGHGGMK